MDSVAIKDDQYRKTLFTETGVRMNIDPALVEKDFWVCWILKRLFALPLLSNHLIFKGGTTLSKVHAVVERFSEDIDLTIDRSVFGYGGENDPTTASSAKKREKMLTEMGTSCSRFVQQDIRDDLNNACASALNELPEKRRIGIDERDTDEQTLFFYYPLAVAVDSPLPYIESVIRLEFGSRGELWPTSNVPILPYAALHFPDSFINSQAEVTALTAERTFREKATILHQETNRPDDKPMPERCSRHYYDLAMLAQSSVRQSALQQAALLETVVQHKKHFFRCCWANYEAASPGTLSLIPTEKRIKTLQRDYRQMQVMMFDEPPSFDKILDILKELEREINNMAQ